MLSLFGWGPGDKQFFPSEPLAVTRDRIILLAPLA